MGTGGTGGGTRTFFVAVAAVSTIHLAQGLQWLAQELQWFPTEAFRDFLEAGTSMSTITTATVGYRGATPKVGYRGSRLRGVVYGNGQLAAFIQVRLCSTT